MFAGEAGHLTRQGFPEKARIASIDVFQQISIECGLKIVALPILFAIERYVVRMHHQQSHPSVSRYPVELPFPNRVGLFAEQQEQRRVLRESGRHLNESVPWLLSRHPERKYSVHPVWLRLKWIRVES